MLRQQVFHYLRSVHFVWPLLKVRQLCSSGHVTRPNLYVCVSLCSCVYMGMYVVLLVPCLVIWSRLIKLLKVRQLCSSDGL